MASAGARHPFETYLGIQNIEGLKSGIDKYFALEHKLLFLSEEQNLKEKIIDEGTLLESDNPSDSKKIIKLLQGYKYMKS